MATRAAHKIACRWLLKVSEHGHAFARARKVIQSSSFTFSGMGEGEQVQDALVERRAPMRR